MEKIIVFTEKDEELLQQIKTYQAKKSLSFDDAIKELCQIAVSNEGKMEWGTF